MASRAVRLDRNLVSKLREREVRVDRPDRNSLLLRDVPTNQRYFNKERTNVILAKSREDEPYLVCVDQDLEYQGGDSALARAFADGPIQAGWRAIFAPSDAGDVRLAVEQALAALGFESSEPCLPGDRLFASAANQARLADLGKSVGADAAEGGGEITVGREKEISAVAAAVLKWGQTRLPVVVGESGVGKTNLIQAIGGKLKQRMGSLKVVSVEVASLFAGEVFPADKEAAIAALLGETIKTPDTVLVLERLDLVGSETSLGGLIVAESLDAGLRIIGTALPAGLPHLMAGPLKRRLHVVSLSEPTPTETLEILRALRSRLCEHHGVDIDESCLKLCVNASQSLKGCLPAKAIDLLDTASALAGLAGAGVAGPDDVLQAVESACAVP